MSSDPASLRVEFVVSGLSWPEAQELLGNLPVGAHGITLSRHPGESVLRYAFDVSTSVSGAAWALRSLEKYLSAVADSDRRAESPPGHPAALPTNVGARLPDDERYVRLGPDAWGREHAEEPHKKCCSNAVRRPAAGREPVRNDVYPTVPSLD